MRPNTINQGVIDTDKLDFGDDERLTCVLYTPVHEENSDCCRYQILPRPRTNYFLKNPICQNFFICYEHTVHEIYCYTSQHYLQSLEEIITPVISFRRRNHISTCTGPLQNKQG